MANKKSATKASETKATESKASATVAKPKDPPVGMSVARIPMNLVRIVPGFNVRQIDTSHPDGLGAREPYAKGSDANKVPGAGSMGTSLATLAADMKKNGLVQPILVRPRTDGPGYDLVSGHRRHAAATTLGWTSIDAVIRPMNEEEAYLINLTENVQREDLAPGEIADRAILLRQKFPEKFAPGEKGNSEALASAIGVSKPYMMNLIRMRENLIPEIWALVRSGRNPNAPPHHLIHKWLGFDRDEQLDAFHTWQGVKAKRNEEDGAGSEGGEGGEGSGASVPEVPKPEYKRPSREALEGMEQEIMGRLRNKLIAEAEAKVALAVVRYAIGKVNKDGNAPPPPYRAATSPTSDDKPKKTKAN